MPSLKSSDLGRKIDATYSGSGIRPIKQEGGPKDTEVPEAQSATGLTVESQTATRQETEGVTSVGTETQGTSGPTNETEAATPVTTEGVVAPVGTESQDVTIEGAAAGTEVQGAPTVQESFTPPASGIEAPGAQNLVETPTTQAPEGATPVTNLPPESKE